MASGNTVRGEWPWNPGTASSKPGGVHLKATALMGPKGEEEWEEGEQSPIQGPHFIVTTP